MATRRLEVFENLTPKEFRDEFAAWQESSAGAGATNIDVKTVLLGTRQNKFNDAGTVEPPTATSSANDFYVYYDAA